MIPFFVADRQMSLHILKGLKLPDNPEKKIGLMAHANTTANFQRAFRDYPCENRADCAAINKPCPYTDEEIAGCFARQKLLRQTVKMCDSGIFNRGGCLLSYDKLFEAYTRMGVEYGVMIDVLREGQATVESAKEALGYYDPGQHSFKLVAVAQGQDMKEYLTCYQQLRELGFEHIGVGGLLQKKADSCYVQVRDEDFMFEVLGQIRQRFKPAWLFALGSFHPNRMSRFQELSVWGDYKGYSFAYEKRDDSLDDLLGALAHNHIPHLSPEHARDLPQVVELICLVSKRERLSKWRRRLRNDLTAGKQLLRRSLRDLRDVLQSKDPKSAQAIEQIMTYGLPKENARKVLADVQATGVIPAQADQSITDQIAENRRLKDRLNRVELLLEKRNTQVMRMLNHLQEAPLLPDPELIRVVNQIYEISRMTEHEYRLWQIRSAIETRVLSGL